MILTPEQAIEFGKELVSYYNEDYRKLVESSYDNGFCAELKDEDLQISLDCFSNKEAHRIFFSYIPEDKTKRTYYELDINYDDRFNSFYDLMENVYEIFTECEEGLERNIERIYKNK